MIAEAHPPCSRTQETGVCVGVCVGVFVRQYGREGAFLCKAGRVHNFKCVSDRGRQRAHLSATDPDRLEESYLKFPSQSASN